MNDGQNRIVIVSYWDLKTLAFQAITSVTLFDNKLFVLVVVLEQAYPRTRTRTILLVAAECYAKF